MCLGIACRRLVIEQQLDAIVGNKFLSKRKQAAREVESGRLDGNPAPLLVTMRGTLPSPVNQQIQPQCLLLLAGLPAVCSRLIRPPVTLALPLSKAAALLTPHLRAASTAPSLKRCYSIINALKLLRSRNPSQASPFLGEYCSCLHHKTLSSQQSTCSNVLSEKM